MAALGYEYGCAGQRRTCIPYQKEYVLLMYVAV